MTAVQWLETELQARGPVGEERPEWLKDLFDKAKEIEKEQRLTDYNVGYSDALCNHIRDGENYVNETSSKA